MRYNLGIININPIQTMSVLGRPARNGIAGSVFEHKKKVHRPPAHLTADAKAVWKRVVSNNPHLQSPGYAELLEAYCGAVVRLRKASAQLDEEGVIDVNRLGDTRANPLIGVIKSAESSIARLASSFGISVAAKSHAGRKPQPAVPDSVPKKPRGLRLA